MLETVMQIKVCLYGHGHFSLAMAKMTFLQTKFTAKYMHNQYTKKIIISD